MFNLFLIIERIISPIGEANHLNFYTADNFSQYLSQTDRCVVFFGSPGTHFDFANFAIYQFKNTISFIRAASELGKRYGCKNSKCILPFKKGKLIKTEDPPNKPIGFSKWVAGLALPPIVEIRTPEALIKLFETPGSHIFGIEFPSRPDWLDDGKVFYNVNLAVIQYLELNLNPGLYIYRAADRQIIPASKNYKNYLKSPLVDFRVENTEIKPIYGGLFVKPATLPEITENEIKILSRLASTFKNISFGIFYEKIAEQEATKYRLTNFKPPFFALFDTRPLDEISQYPVFNSFIQNQNKDQKIDENLFHESIPRRWAKIFDLDNETMLTEFVSRILQNKEPYSQISDKQKAFNNAFLQLLTYNSFNEVINRSDHDVFIWFVDITSYPSQKAMVILNETASIVKKSNLTTFLYPLGTNDIPDNIQLDEIPFALFYPALKNEPVIFDDEIDIENILAFIQAEASFPIELNDYNPNDIRNKVRTLLAGDDENDSNSTNPISSDL